MRNIALPVKGGYLNHSFENALCFHVFHVKKDKIIEDVEVVDHSILLETFEQWCRDNKITDVIAFKIGEDATKILNKNKVNVYLGVAQKPAYHLVRELINGTLITNSKIIET